MKAKQIEQLHSDLIKYSKQIGITDTEIPMLITDRKEYHGLLVANKQPKRAAGYGECNWELKTIFVDCGIRTYQHMQYRRSVPEDLKHSNNNNKNYFYKVRWNSKKIRVFKKVKARYNDKLHVLIHELIHYRFKSLGHGIKFEERVKEVERGVTFPVKQLYQ